MAKQNMKAPVRQAKRDSATIDALIDEVDSLVNHPDRRKQLSVKKACAKVGLQTTVYYYRKRQDDVLNAPGLDNVPVSVSRVTRTELREHKTTDDLLREYREVEARLNSLKLMIAEKVMSGEKIREKN